MKTLNEYIEDMLLYKESIGYTRKSYEYDLSRFCKFIESKHFKVSDLKEDVILSWCSRWESETSTSARRRIQSIREFLKYLSAIGIDCYVIPSNFLQFVYGPHSFFRYGILHPSLTGKPHSFGGNRLEPFFGLNPGGGRR